MSGCRDQSSGIGHTFLSEVRRILGQFWANDVSCHEITPHVKTRAQEAFTPCTTDVYGGVFATPENTETKTVQIGIAIDTQNVDTQLALPVVTLPIFQQAEMQVYKAELTTEQLMIQTHSEALPNWETLSLENVTVRFDDQPIKALPILSPIMSSKPRLLKPERFQRPRVLMAGRLKTKAFLATAATLYTTMFRRPMSPSSFSKSHRALFRELLAEKTQLNAAAIQLVAVYDRLHLDQYQSVSQTPEMMLMCTPKSSTSPKLSKVMGSKNTSEPAYLVIGKSYRNPGVLLQATLLMKELPHA